jgi:Glycosyl transferase family 11
MVTVFLRGRLGNQMFQYALGLHLAQKNNTQLLLDTTFIHDRFPRREFTYHDFELDIFDIEPRFTALSRISGSVPVPGLWLGLDLGLTKAADVLGARKIIKEKQEHVFDPTVLNARGNLLLWGRWQNEKYFADIATAVRRAFTFRHPLEGEAKALGEEIAACNAVSLHVRRGDYATFKSVEKLMGAPDLSYYARAVEYMGKHVRDPQFFVFSDDIAWCKDNLRLSYPVTFVEPSSAGPKSAFHFELMTRCKHNIIANSTFSWWAAWRNENQDKIVVSPTKWYASGMANDIVPQTWVAL